MILLTIGCSAAVLVSSILLYNSDLNTAMYEKINVALSVAEHEINILKNNSYIAALGMANNPDLIEALENNDREKMASTALNLINVAVLDFCTVLDAGGNVMTRTHEPDNYGDSLARLSHVRSALAGETKAYVIPGNTLPLSVAAGAPIRDRNMKIIGAVSLGYRLDTQDFAQRLKEITNCEITIFLNDVRVSTTIITADGTFAIGTKADKDVSEKVLAGEVYIGKIDVLGREAFSLYTPLYGGYDEVVGMLFVGFYTDQDINKQILFIASGLMITLIILVFSFFIANFVSSIIEKRLETMMEDIREADEYTQLLLDAMPVSCTLRDKDFNLINCNREALKLYGVDSKEELEEKFFELCPEFQPNGESSRQLIKEWNKTAYNEGFLRREWMHQFPNGDPIPCEATLVRVKHRNDFLIAGYVRDLREHKEYLAEIENAHENLRSALDAAENANRAKTIFLAKMSHEIRTPMNSIIGFSELAKDGPIPVKTREYLNSISESAEWLLQIINDILDISKIESGKMVLENIPFNLHDIFAYCQSVIMPKTIEKGISLYCYAEPSIGKKLLGDPVKLRQALINLLSNAVKFTNVGTVKLFASIKKAEKNKVTVYFEVKDSGIGMTHHQIERIFEPFNQADDSITRKYGGTGLGLTITRNFIEMMGGRLNVESMTGVGSKFGFELDFDVISDVSDIPVEKISHANIEKPNFEGEVLVCEDNTMNQKVIFEHLAKVGLKTVIAENGKEGVDIVAKRMQKNEPLFDLIFMDIHMPVMDGLEAAAKITALGVKTPIVAITANIMSNDVELYKANGMSEFIGKPFTSQELWKCLLKYFAPKSFTAVEEHQFIADYDKLQNYLKVNFVKDNKNKIEEITKAADEGDLKLTHRLVHSLKTNAGQIGEKKLQETAAEVEKMILEGKDILEEEKYGNLMAEMEMALGRLEPLLAEAVKNNAPQPPDKSKIQVLFDKLEVMLNDRNPETIKLIDDIRAIPDSEELLKQIEDYEFKQALACLYELKEKTSV
jgi:signal transduction histidine kinase/response regulator of citrate/malate metabolism